MLMLATSGSSNLKHLDFTSWFQRGYCWPKLFLNRCWAITESLDLIVQAKTHGEGLSSTEAAVGCVEGRLMLPEGVSAVC